MIKKKLEEIVESDLEALIRDCVQEGKTIEYKSNLKIGKDTEKKEFLADISSFANAIGGDLIFGVLEDKGLPDKIVGLEIEDSDSEILRIESMIREGIEPRLPSVNIYPVPLSNGKISIIIRIGKSWISPHRVIFKGHDKFYTRSSNGKYPMDVSELRNSFNLTETISEKIRKFRENRISSIIADDTPLPLEEGAKIVLHLIPLISFSPGKRIEIEHNKDKVNNFLRPLSGSGWDHRYNFDGFLTFYNGGRGEKFQDYTQLFRNGTIEAVDASMLRNLEGNHSIFRFYEGYIIERLGSYINLFKVLGIELPILVFLTFVGVKGYQLKVDRFSYPDEIVKIDRDILAPPEIILENYEEKLPKVLKPIFDTIWNSCGFPRSYNYDENGEWKT